MQQAIKGAVFSSEGCRELSCLHSVLVGNIRFTHGFPVGGDPATARQLLDAKRRLPGKAMRSQSKIFDRILGCRLDCIGSSILCLDIWGELRRVSSNHSTAACPVLVRRGGER